MLSIKIFKVLLIMSTLCYNFWLVKCAIPALSVRKVDDKLIERKRQDTLELCRLFNEENSRLKIGNTSTRNIIDHQTETRIKRNVNYNKIHNPDFKQKDMLRVEKIVDKLYDDLEQDGNHITYRHKSFKHTTKSQAIENKLNRRFNFAPAQLYGPLEEKLEQPLKSINSTLLKIPWIKKWKYGIIPYFIDPNTYDSILSDIILKAFDYLEKVSCIRLQRLREKPTDKLSLQNVEWLYITNPSSIKQCVHSNERKPNSGVQMVVFGYDCMSQGEIAHEVMHILGFSHEHTRSDRDRYISILWDNIKSGYKKYFNINHEDRLLSLPYDYASILHYPPRAFSKNGQITVMAKSGIKVGQREALSELDIEKIGMIYSLECVERNKDYLTKTCPSVVNNNPKTKEVTREDIQEYFKNRIWPYGIINYKIKDKMEFTAEERENIKAVFNHIEKETCIEFRDIAEEDGDKDDSTESQREEQKKENSENKNESLSVIDEKTRNTTKRFKKTITFERVKLPLYIQKSNNTFGDSTLNYERRSVKKTISPISPARRHAANIIMLVRSAKPGCHCPSPGRPNGNKEFTINADCFNSVNDLLHLFMHMLGLDHQHNMHDRDSFLHIVWDNLTPELKEEMMNTLPPAASAGFGYDYQSVMHYPWLQIKNGVTNIMYPVWNDGWAMGHWQGLSWADVQKLNLIYMDECENRKQHTKNI